MNIELREFTGRRVLCAVSGGADSMCLLHLLKDWGADVTAAHFEHGIRGEESLRDAQFVNCWCAENDIPCVIGRGDVPKYASEHSMGIEESARTLRYEFLQSAAEARGCELIATAHNLDDNAETVIFDLTRGAGSAGMRGIPARRGNIVRPLLNVPRAEIEEYLARNDIPHVEDSTNSSDDYSRNLIRHRVMPALREINPAVSEALGRAARLAAQDDDCLNALAESFLKENFDGESVALDRLNALHGAVASRVIRALAVKSLTLRHVESVLELCRGTERGYIDLPEQRMRVEQGRLWLSEESTERLPERRIIVGGRVELPEAGLAVYAEETIFNREVNGLFKTYYLKCENINSDIVVTGRRAGDKFRPRGRGCSKSLKKLFAEKGLTAAERDTCPILRDSDGILAVCGFAQDERTAPEVGDRVIEIRFEKLV